MLDSILSANKDLFFQTFGLAGHNSLLDFLMAFSANYLILIALILIFILPFTKGVTEKKALILILLAFGIGFILIKTIGIFINEPRPFMTYAIKPLINHAADDSFPSDHTIIMTIIAASYSYYRSKYSTFFIIFLFLTGIARVYVGVHYPLDIVGGIILGIIAVWIASKLKKYLVNKLSI